MKKILRLAWLTFAFGVAAFAADLPIVVSRLVTGPSSHVELTNNAKQPATAWSVVMTSEANGRVHRVVQTRDTYIAEVTRGLPGSQEELDWLLPGSTRRMTLDPLPEGAAAEVLAVVMEDGTSVGDAETIKSIFARRTAERDALRHLVDTFRTVLPGTSGVAALEDLKTRLAASASDETAQRAAVEAVDKFLQQAKAGAENDADQALRKYAAFVERQHDVAVKHARPRP
jgi:hypothetical protein